MIFDRKDFSFMEKVALGGHFAGTSTNSKGLILESLKFFNVRNGGVREPNRGGIVYYRTD